MIKKNFKLYPGATTMIWIKYEKLTPIDALKIRCQRVFALCFLHLVSDRLNGVNINSVT